MDGLTARKKTLAERIAELATDPAWWPTVARLRAFRGVDTLTALAIHLELGADWARFEKPHSGRVLAGTDPLAPAVRRVRPAGIDHEDRIDARPPACWSSPPGNTPANPGSASTLKNRQDGQPDHVLQITNRAQQRLHHLYTSMRARGKPHNVTIVAVARELSCFLWAAATAP